MAGYLANIFGGAGAPGGAGAGGPPAVAALAGIGDLTNVFQGVAWDGDVAQFGTNAATRSVQADIQATAGSTNTSQDSLFNIPRSGFVYLPNAVIIDINSFCAPVWNSHQGPGGIPFDAATMLHGNSTTAYGLNAWAGCTVTSDEFSQHAAAIYTRAVALAYGDTAILAALLDAAKQGQFPHGPFVLPDVPRESIFKMSAARIFYILMGWHGAPAKIRSLEEAMGTLNLQNLGVDAFKLTPDGIRETMANGDVPALDRVHALYGHITYLWASQEGKEASTEDTSSDAFAIARRVSAVLDLPELAQPKNQTDRRKKIADAVLIASYLAGVADPVALVALFIPRFRNPPVAQTMADIHGSPANLDTSLPIKSLAARFPPEIKLDGKLEERFQAGKLFLSGHADLKWVSESLRLLQNNGMEALFVSPTSADNIAALLQRAQDVGLIGHIGAKNVGFDGTYVLNLGSEV